MRKTARTALVLLILLAGGVASADVVVLKSGKLIEGELVSFEKNELQLKVEAGVTILGRQKIKSLHFGVTVKEYEAERAPRPGSAADKATPATPATGFLSPSESLKGKFVSVKVNKVEVATTGLKNLMGGASAGKTPDLQITLEVRNTTERKILRYRKPIPFMRSPLLLHDDVENQVRGINYGLGKKVVGALTGNEDILPGTAVTHLLVFTVPPPKTKFVVLSVDLDIFGDKGRGEFKIPASSILGLTPIRAPEK